MKKLLFGLLVLCVCVEVDGEWGVGDGGKVGENVKNYVEVEKEVDILREEKSKVDEGVDMMGKVNCSVSNWIRVKKIMEGEVNLWKMWIEIVWKYELGGKWGESLSRCMGEILGKKRKMISVFEMIL